MQHTTRKQSLTIAAVVAVLVCTAVAGDPATKSTEWEHQFHSIIPLGGDALLLTPEKKTVYLLASAESPTFQGMQGATRDGRYTLVNERGDRVEFFPDRLNFRVTASVRKDKLSDLHAYPMPASVAAEDYVLNLGFRLKVFRGIEYRTVRPYGVKLIGVPADVPHEERVYRVSFELRDVHVDDRLVLEILAPSGERVSKFALALY